MNIAFVIMAKTPELKVLRNRLSRSTNKDFAAKFYKISLEATKDLVLEMARCNSDIELVWAVEEKEGLKSDYWENHPTIYQGDGGLGDRMDKVYKSLIKEYDAVFIMMPNSAQIAPMVLEFDILNFLTSDNDFILGKTDRGDFYFFGGSKEVPLKTWLSVNYSCSITFRELSKAMSLNGRVLHMSESFGVLERGDLQNFSGIETAGLLVAQEKLVDFALGAKFEDRFADLVRL